jgi:hypothetical protein
VNGWNALEDTNNTGYLDSGLGPRERFKQTQQTANGQDAQTKCGPDCANGRLDKGEGIKRVSGQTLIGQIWEIHPHYTRKNIIYFNLMFSKFNKSLTGKHTNTHMDARVTPL